MSVLNVLWPQTGLVPNTTTTTSATTLPSVVYIQTNDTLATATTAGYLNKAAQLFGPFSNSQMALVYTTDDGVVWLQVSATFSGSTASYSLVVPASGAGSFTTVKVNDGSAAAPSYSFVNDTDLGLYRIGANNLGVAANGAKVLDIATTGLTVTGLISATTSIAAGTNITAGSSGTAGTVSSFPATATTGSLKLAAVSNSGDTVTTISNAAMGQASVVSIPDPGAATANFILSAATTTQTLSTGLSFVGGGTNIQTTGGGNFLAGASGAAGFFVSYPTTATSGDLELKAIDNTAGDFTCIISNSATIAQSQTVTIPDVGGATGSFLVSSLVATNPGANIITQNITVTQADLATGGSKVLQASSGTDQFRIIAMYLNSGGTNFSGGGGDRLGQVTDGTTVYSVIPAGTLQALVNAGWGYGSDLPFPAAAAINTATAAAADLVFSYSGGATDYTTGSLDITVVLEKIA